jgi:hypothetical protein
MKIERLAIHLRLCTPMQAADLGVRLCQHAAPSVYRSYLLVLVPVAALCAASVEISSSLPVLLLWWAKPWLDRTILFTLSRAAFGSETEPRELWAAQRDVWWSQWWRTWTLRRLTASRACTQPIIQLEGQRGAGLRRRLREIHRGRVAAARLLTLVFSNVEFALCIGCASLWLLFAPSGSNAWQALARWYVQSPMSATLCTAFFPYLIAVAFLEPFYVAAGFGIYLNRRVELEAWDIEQDLRHAFAR